MHLARALREADAARKAQAADSAKLKYQIQHLRQSLREADQRKSSEQ